MSPPSAAGQSTDEITAVGLPKLNVPGRNLPRGTSAGSPRSKSLNNFPSRASAIPDLDAAADVAGAGVSGLWVFYLLAFSPFEGRALGALVALAIVVGTFHAVLWNLRRSGFESARLRFALLLGLATSPALTTAIVALLNGAAQTSTSAPVIASALLLVTLRTSQRQTAFAAIVCATTYVGTLVVLGSTPEEIVGPAAFVAAIGLTFVVAADAMGATRQTLTHLAQRAVRVEKQLKRYVSSDVARAIIDGDREASKPSRQHVTVVFCDLRGFTFLCERERPEDVVELLNTVYEGACAIIQKEGGSVNKFLGDGLLALFKQDAHAESAVRAGAEIQKLIRRLRERGGIWTHLALGIGIDSGPVVAGPIGATNRVEHTVIGSPVNRAARLQAFAERDRYRIVLSAAVSSDLPESFRVRSLGPVELKGFSRAEEIFAFNGEDSADLEPDA